MTRFKPDHGIEHAIAEPYKGPFINYRANGGGGGTGDGFSANDCNIVILLNSSPRSCIYKCRGPP